jgi:hypothetical protein
VIKISIWASESRLSEYPDLWIPFRGDRFPKKAGIINQYPGKFKFGPFTSVLHFQKNSGLKKKIRAR